MALLERPLDGVQAAVVGRQPLDGRHLVALRADREHQATADRFAVEQHGAGPADAVLAADVGAGQMQVVAQGVAQQAPGRHVDLPGLAAPVGVVVSCETAPRVVGAPIRSSTVAGAGTGNRP